MTPASYRRICALASSVFNMSVDDLLREWRDEYRQYDELQVVLPWFGHYLLDEIRMKMHY